MSTAKTQHDRQWLLWVALLTCFSGCIVLLTYTVKNGGISHDGCYYLQLAKSIKADLSFFQTRLGESGKAISVYFPASRPAGYPLAIATLSGLTQLPVLIGAKLLAIICGCLIAVLFYRLYGQEGVAPAALLITSLCLELAFSVLSGMLFTALLVGWVYALHNGFAYGFSWLRVGGVALIGGAIFATRYVGIVVLPVLAILAVYHPSMRQFHWDLKRLILFAGTATLIGGYLLMNYYFAGYALPDHPAQNPSLFQLLGDFISEFVNSFNLLFTILYRGVGIRFLALAAALVVQVSVLFFWLKRFRPSFQKLGTVQPLTQIAGLTAVLYLGLLLGLYLVKFYTLSYRFMVPVVVLGGWGLFHQLYTTQSATFLRMVRYSLLSLAVISVCFNGMARSAYHLLWKPTPTFPEHLTRIQNRYQDIPAGSVVLFPEKDLLYLRPDLIPNYSALRSEPQEWTQSMVTGSNIDYYLNTCDPVFSAFMQKTYPENRERWRHFSDTASTCLTTIP
jgi:hypothetical protein